MNSKMQIFINRIWLIRGKYTETTPVIY